MGQLQLILSCVFLGIFQSDASIFSNEPQSQQIGHAGWAHLDCILESDVDVCYWIINGRQMHPSSEFSYLNTFTRNCSVVAYGRNIQSGYYTCVVQRNETIYYSREATVFISDSARGVELFTGEIKNDLTLVKEQFVIKKESQENLYCRVRGLNVTFEHPEINIWWELDGENVSSTLYILNRIWISQLTEPIKSKHYGKRLTCNFKYRGFPTNTTQTATVIILGIRDLKGPLPPEIPFQNIVKTYAKIAKTIFNIPGELDTKDVFAVDSQEDGNVGGQVKPFDCSHNMGNSSDVECHWEYISGHSSYVDDYDRNRMLVIRQTERNHDCHVLNERQSSGLWSCIVQNGTHFAKSKPTIFFAEQNQSQPEIRSGSHIVNGTIDLILLNQTFVVECSVTTTLPGTKLRWLLDGKEVEGMIPNVRYSQLRRYRSRHTPTIFTALSSDNLKEIADNSVIGCEAVYPSYLNITNTKDVVRIKRITPDVKRQIFHVEPTGDIEVDGVLGVFSDRLKCGTFEDYWECEWFANSKLWPSRRARYVFAAPYRNLKNCDAGRFRYETLPQDGYFTCNVLIPNEQGSFKWFSSKAAKLIILEYLKPIPVVYGAKKIKINEEVIAIVDSLEVLPSVEFHVHSFWARNLKATLMLDEEEIPLGRQLVHTDNFDNFNIVAFKSVHDMTVNWFGKKLKFTIYYTLKNGMEYEDSATVSIKALEKLDNGLEVEPEDVSLRLNDTVALKCISTIKYETCFWERNGINVNLDYFLEYQDGSGYDCSLTMTYSYLATYETAFNYVCYIVLNNTIKASRNASVIYLVQPSGPNLFVNSLVPQDGIVILENNGSKWLNLLCEVSRLYPEGELWFEKNGTVISTVSNDTSLRKLIGRTTLSEQSIEHWLLVDSEWDNTELRCGVSHEFYENGVPHYSNVIALLTTAKPKYIRLSTNKGASNDILVKSDESVDLHCFAPASPAATYSWQKWMEGDEWQNVSKSNTLTLKNEFGAFRCLAENVHGHVTSLERIAINIIPVNVTINAESSTENVIYVKENDMITLVCKAIGYPKPIYIWKRKRAAESHWSIIGYSNIVSFRGQTGQFSCTALNRYGENNSTELITIELEGKPKNVTITSNIGDGDFFQVRRDEVVSFYCTAMRGLRPYYKWSKTTSDEINGYQVVYSYSQNMSFVNLEGKFQCIVSNEYGEVVSEKHFTVELV